MTNKAIGFFQKYETRVVRLHLATIGYFTYCLSTLIFGIHEWKDCVLTDKILSVCSMVFILQVLMMKITDLPIKLKLFFYLSVFIFIYLHFIK
jgi:hypothetical protein